MDNYTTKCCQPYETAGEVKRFYTPKYMDHNTLSRLLDTDHPWDCRGTRVPHGLVEMPFFYTSNGSAIGGMNFAWCSDWEAYENHPEVPVFYVEAHHDICYEKRMMPPIILDGDILIATGHDNRASCLVSHRFACGVHAAFHVPRDENYDKYRRTAASASAGSGGKRQGQGRGQERKKADVICYCLWTDKEESGMMGIDQWFKTRRVEHEKEMFVVLDVTTPAVSTYEYDDGELGSCNLGRGAYSFAGDPHETLGHQPCNFREKYPGNLVYTHAGFVYYQHGFSGVGNHVVSRMAIPVVGISSKSGKRSTSSMHDRITAASLGDIDSLEDMLCDAYRSWKP